MRLHLKFYIAVVTLICLSNFLMAQTIFQIKDYDGNIVEFFFTSRDGKTVLTSNDGQLDMTQLEQHKSKRFTLHFDNHLAYLLYHRDLYFKNGTKLKDKHIAFDKVTFAKVVNAKDGVFYVRRKEIRLDGKD